MKNKNGNDEKSIKYLEELILRIPALASSKEDIKSSYQCLVSCFENGNKLLVGGNGGSNADAEHIVGELMKGFILPRTIPNELKDTLISQNPELGEFLAKNLQQSLRAISLNSLSLSTAIANDCDGSLILSQHLLGLADPGDAFLAISTSGNSRNIILASITAKSLGLKVIALTGRDGGRLKEIADISIIAPTKETHLIQELHVPIYHTLCLMLEQHFFGE